MRFETTGRGILRAVLRHKSVLREAARQRFVEMYAGSMLGSAWALLFPLLFLCIYLFVFLVVFRFRFPGMSTAAYVLYVFSGLVPYMALMQAMTEGATAIRSNIQLVRSVILPIELIPVRVVMTCLVSQIPGFVLILIIGATQGELTPALLLLPFAIIIEFAFLAGIAWTVAPLGLVLPDVGQIVNLLSLFLLFISPISFQADQLNGYMQLIVYLNPVYYFLLPFRAVLIPGIDFAWWELGISALLAAVVFSVGLATFARAKRVMVDAA